MKKTCLYATLTGMIAGATLALAQGPVYSVNIVGFNKTHVEDGKFIMTGNPFNNGDNSPNQVLSDQLTGSDVFTAADQLYLFDPSIGTAGGYVTIYKTASGNWVYAGGAVVATNALNPGVGFWVKNSQSTSSTQTVVTVGDVVDDDMIIIPVVEGFQILSYPYTSEIALNDTGLTNGYGTNIFSAADQLYLFNSANQSYLTYYLNSDGAFYAAGSNTPTTQVISPGQGFWYKHASSGFSWVEEIPYAAALP